MLTHALLRYPAVATEYFALILQLCELYPANVARLPASHFQPLVASLEWGLEQAAAEVVSPCLQSAEELASYHYRARLGGEAGLSGTVLAGALCTSLAVCCKKLRDFDEGKTKNFACLSCFCH